MTDLCSLKGKNVVITGAGGVLGTQIAILFAKAQAQTLLLSDISPAALESLHQTLRLHASLPETRLLFHPADVSDERQVESLFGQLDQFGGVDVVVNSAGYFAGLQDGDALMSHRDAWDATYRVNVVGTWLGSKHGVLSMRRHAKARGGSVVNVSSVAALVGSATSQLAYTASKGAVVSMTRELGIVHAREGIRFNCLCPGPLNSKMLQDFLDADDGGSDEDHHVRLEDDGTAARPLRMGKRQRREVHLPQGRFGEGIESAGAALFLASDASAFVNSTELVVDGGLTKAFVTPEGLPSRSYLQNFATVRDVVVSHIAGGEVNGSV